MFCFQLERISPIEKTKDPNVGLVELFMEEYVSAIVMPTKKNIFGNWIEFHMCGDYCLMNK
jgi:hypothetical protein